MRNFLILIFFVLCPFLMFGEEVKQSVESFSNAEQTAIKQFYTGVSIDYSEGGYGSLAGLSVSRQAYLIDKIAAVEVGFKFGYEIHGRGFVLSTPVDLRVYVPLGSINPFIILYPVEFTFGKSFGFGWSPDGVFKLGLNYIFDDGNKIELATSFFTSSGYSLSMCYYF